MSWSRSVAVAVGVSLLSAAGAVECYLQASALRTEASWILARGNAAAAQYATSFDSSVAEQQLAAFDRRRDVLERASLWQRFQLLFGLLSAVSAFCSYLFHLFRRLRDQLVEGTRPLDEDAPVAPSSSSPLVGSSQTH